MPSEEVTIAQLAQQENAVLRASIEKYAHAYRFANDALSLISTGITGYSESRRVFGFYLSQIVTNLTLALLSALRQHRTQVYSNLRHALEHTGLTAYALANPEDPYFLSDLGAADHDGFMRRTVYKWIAKAYPIESIEIQRLKTLINRDHAHASIVHAFRNLTEPEGEFLTVKVDLFDSPEPDSIKADLIHIGHIASVAIDTVVAVAADNRHVRGRTGFETERARIRMLRDVALEDYESGIAASGGA